MSSAAALPSVKILKLSLQERANMQTTRDSNDRIGTINIIPHFWHFWGWENMSVGEKVGELGPLINRDILYLIGAAFIPPVS